MFVALFYLNLLVSLVFNPNQVSAAGPKCFINVQSRYFRVTECPSNSSVDPNNDSSKTGTCYFIADVSLRQGRSTFTPIHCLKILQTNQNCVQSACHPDATADGIGGSSQDPNRLNEGDLPGSGDRSSIVDCNGNTPQGAKRCLEKNPLVVWTLRGINFLAAGAGIIIAVSIVIAGIQYASAGPNPQQVTAAKKRIISSIVALLALFFLYAFLQWLVPGGVF